MTHSEYVTELHTAGVTSTARQALYPLHVGHFSSSWEITLIETHRVNILVREKDDKQDKEKRYRPHRMKINFLNGGGIVQEEIKLIMQIH